LDVSDSTPKRRVTAAGSAYILPAIGLDELCSIAMEISVL
jgi:hypothetical protein